MSNSIMVTRNITSADIGKDFVITNLPCFITFQNQYGRPIGIKKTCNIDENFIIPEKTKILVIEWIYGKMFPSIEETKISRSTGVEEEDIPESCLENAHEGTKLRSARTLRDGSRLFCCTNCRPHVKLPYERDYFNLKPW